MSESNQGDDSNEEAEAEGASVRVIRIVNQKGLHARASAKFVHDWKVKPPQSCSGCHR